jgi:hypothetical protein
LSGVRLRDPELRNWFKCVDAFIYNPLLEPGFILEPACNKEANELRELLDQSKGESPMLVGASTIIAVCAAPGSGNLLLASGAVARRADDNRTLLLGVPVPASTCSSISADNGIVDALRVGVYYVQLRMPSLSLRWSIVSQSCWGNWQHVVLL